jgi:hypothetical protein
MTYRAPLAEMEFCAAQIIGQDRLAETALFAEAAPETRSAILDEAAKLCEGVLAPVNREGDLHPARLENGVVRCPPRSPRAAGSGLPATRNTAAWACRFASPPSSTR